MQRPTFVIFRHLRIPFLVLLTVGLVGCATKKPLPFAYSTPRVAAPNAPGLTLQPTADQRSGKNKMDKLLDLPKGLDSVIAQELKNSGLFGKVELKENKTLAAGLVLQCTLHELEWE